MMHGNGDGTFVVNSYVAKPRTSKLGLRLHSRLLTSTVTIISIVLAGSDETLTFLHGNGDGSLAGYRKTFLETTEIGWCGAAALVSALEGLAVADFNGDGKPDVALEA